MDLRLTAFIPNSYIPDLEQKMEAYRNVATVSSQMELKLIEAEWRDRYGEIPPSAQQLIQVSQLKLKAKSIGFSRIKPEGKNNVVLETPMLEPAWRLLSDNLPKHIESKFVYRPKKVVVKGLGLKRPSTQLASLIEWLDYLIEDK